VLTKQISELSRFISAPPTNYPLNKARVKLADLYIGRNDVGDYVEALNLYKEIISSTLPAEEEHAQAVIGEAELTLQSPDKQAVDMAIYSCGVALESLKNDRRGFFWGKGNILLAELLLKKDSEEDRRSALGIYDDILSHPNVHKYFRMRAAVGKLELMSIFFRDELRSKVEEEIARCESAMEPLRVERPDDYFYLKGLTILAEVMVWHDKGKLGDKARKILENVANEGSAGDDMRARACLDLAEISSPNLARTIIKGVRKMDGIDPYLMRKAKAIEDALHE
jgi:hypothetical protein